MRVQAGVSKLNEAKALVDELKRRAAEQSALLKTKQQEADSALQEITTSMQVRVYVSKRVYEFDKTEKRMEKNCLCGLVSIQIHNSFF